MIKDGFHTFMDFSKTKGAITHAITRWLKQPSHRLGTPGRQPTTQQVSYTAAGILQVYVLTVTRRPFLVAAGILVCLSTSRYKTEKKLRCSYRLTDTTTRQPSKLTVDNNNNNDNPPPHVYHHQQELPASNNKKMPESNAAAKKRQQKANRAMGLGDEQGRMVRVKDPPKTSTCAVCRAELTVTKTNTELKSA